MDLSRALHIADLLDRGATVQSFGKTGLVQLVIAGRVEATTSKATVAQARDLAVAQREFEA